MGLDVSYFNIPNVASLSLEFHGMIMSLWIPRAQVLNFDFSTINLSQVIWLLAKPEELIRW